MKLKGDLDSIGLAELFKTLADQHATGVLAVSSSMGEKQIALQAGAICVVSDKLSERTRLGDLLIARGLIAENQLMDALKEQKQTDPRAKLGDMLIKKGLVKQENITEALRFQVEEEIYDLFTWKGAAFDFDSDRSVEVPGDAAELHQLRIDPQSLIAEATRRMVDWKEIQNRLPTPYLCFKLAPKGEEMLSKATRTAQIVLRLIKEGRTLETTVKRSCLGRFTVSKTVIKLLDDGWVFPYPVVELRMLASEHRAQKRFHDALNIYRRLLESATQDNEREQLQTLIDDTIDAILRAKQAGEAPEGAEIVSHKAAAEQYKRRQRNRRIALAAFCVVSLVAAGFLLLKQYAPKRQLPEDYMIAIRAADSAVAEGKFDEATEVWQNFYQGLRDKESETARRVKERLQVLPLKFESHVEGLLQPYELLEKADNLDEAQAGYVRLLAQYPTSKLSNRMSDGIARIEKTRQRKAQEQLIAKMQARFKEARDLMERKQYSAAKTRFIEVSEAAPAGSKTRQDAEEVLKKLAEMEERSRAALKSAEEELRQLKGEKAIASFDLSAGEWPELPSAETAARESQRLKTRLNLVRQALKRADAAETQGDVLEARDILGKTEREYGEFEIASSLKQRIVLLTGRATQIERKLAEARETFKSDKAEGRKLYADLIRSHSAFLIARKVEVPLFINATPQSMLSIDGKEIGLTPQDVMAPAAKSFNFTLERKGYARAEKSIARLMPDDLELQVRMKREPVRPPIALPGGIFAPPRVIDGVLYVLHGTSLSALTPSGDKTLWTLENLFDDSAKTRPNSSGSGPEIPFQDKTWWIPRSPPEPLGEGKLLLALRTRDIVEVNTLTKKVKKLFTVPTEPVGRVCVERASLAAGKTLVAVGCADGKVRVFDLAQPAAPQWERAADPAQPAPKGTLVAGLSPRPAGSFLALSESGRLTCFSLIDKERWSLDFKRPLAKSATLPASAQDGVATIVQDNGVLSVIDLSQETKLWDLPVNRAGDEAFSAVADGKAVYVQTRQGEVRQYLRERAANPEMHWRRALNVEAELPLLLDRYLFAVTNATTFALSTETGESVWEYRPERKPSQISVHGPYVYLADEEGRLLILNVEP